MIGKGNKMTVNVDVWQYGNPQHEQLTPPIDERWFYGDPQHDIATPVNVELRESHTYLRSWARYTQQQRHREPDAKRPIPTSPLVATRR